MGTERVAPRASTDRRAAPARLAVPPVPRVAPTTARQPASAKPAAASAHEAVIQRFGNVSSPGDRAEIEAVQISRAVMHASSPARSEVSTRAVGGVQRAAAAGAPALNPKPAQTAATSGGAGNLPAPTRAFMEPRFGADFSSVRVHTGAAASSRAKKLDAGAFTTGRDIYFGKGQFQPDTPKGKELIAHELTHTIQQGAVRQSSVAKSPAVRERPTATTHRAGGIRGWMSDKAHAIVPGFRMFTIVLGTNPITMDAVDRSPANIVRAVVEFMPGGSVIADALESHGILQRVGNWVDDKVRTVGVVAGAIHSAIDKFVDGLGLSALNPLNWGDLWEDAKRIFSEPVARIKSFVANLATEIVQFIREAILLPLAALAEGTRAYDLLKAVLGEDPVTGQPVPRNADTLIGGFMKLIGEEEMWENIKKANAIPRCWAWFQGAMNELVAMVRQVPGRFVAAFKALEVIDMIIVPRAFAKLALVFGGFVVEFITWGGKALWRLLEIVFEVVAPAAIPYLKKAGDSFKQILKNPIAFVGNLVKAGKLGFERFAANIGTHLKKALIEWLTGSLPGVYIPEKLDIKEILKFVLSVLGLTWANIRAKLVAAIGETAVKVLETGFDLVVTLVTQGPAAAWEKIKEQLANLKDMVIGAITNFVVETIVKKAVMKVVSLLIPGGAFLQAIISIYDTVKVFIDKLQKIIAVAKAFLDSMMDIVAGKLDGAAQKVENVLAGLLTLAISFLAGFLGFGKIADKVMEVIKKIRAPIDKALDFLINWIVNAGKKLIGKAKQGAKALVGWAISKKGFKDEKGMSHSITVNQLGGKPRLTIESTPQDALEFVNSYVAARKAKSEDFEIKNSKKIADCKAAIGNSQKLVAEIDKKSTAGKKEEELASEYQKLLDLNTLVAEALRALIGDDRDFGNMRDKYKLEGLAGTYGTIPRPPGDDFTPDHQPQAAAIQAAATFDQMEPGAKLKERAEKRAHKGYSINLHKIRHEAGRTFGFKGKSTKAEFLSAARAAIGSTTDKAEQRRKVIGVLKADLLADVKIMETVVENPKNYKDLESFTTVDDDKQKLQTEIRGRVKHGLTQMKAQNLDTLAE